MRKQEIFKMTVPNDATYLPIVQICVRELSKKFGFDESDINKIELGLEETCVNIIKHAFEKGEDTTFDIICKRIPRGMEIIVEEQGIPFDPDMVPHYTPPSDIDTASLSGLGIYLIRKAFNEVSFRNLGSKGKETHLVKFLKGADTKGYIADSESEGIKVLPEIPPPITEKIDYEIRRMKPEEAIEVSKCAYKSHGYTVYDEIIYYPEQLVKLNETGMMISAVAVTKENTIMGHAALVYQYPSARTAELNFLFINPEYRGQGCVDRYTLYLKTTAEELGLNGLYFFAVTNHIYSQKPMVKYGFVNCGIMLATSPGTMLFKGIDSDTSQRISCITGYLYLKKPESLTLYPPRHHLEMIEMIYRWMGVEHCYRSPAFSEPAYKEEHSRIETTIYTKEGDAVIWISGYGMNVIKEIRTILKELCIKQISCIKLIVSLEDPLTYFLASEFEKMGFFFSGIMPETSIGDALILQYLNNIEFDYGKIKLCTDYGKDILAYIKSCDPNVDRE